jgi:hypothetical protein
MEAMALKMARITAIRTNILRGRETALSRGRVGSGTGSSSTQRGRRARSGLGLTKWLQVISRGIAGLRWAVERLALRRESGASTIEGIMNTVKSAPTKAGLTASLGCSRTAIIAKTRAQTTVSVKRRLSKSSRG